MFTVSAQVIDERQSGCELNEIWPLDNSMGTDDHVVAPAAIVIPPGNCKDYGRLPGRSRHAGIWFSGVCPLTGMLWVSIPF